MTNTTPAPVLEPELLRELAAQARSGEREPGELVALLRSAQLVVEVETTETGHEVVPVRAQGLRWLPVFTTLDHWAQFLIAAGRGDETVGYGWLSGVELFDAVVPQLPAGTGVALDPCPEPVLVLPPTMTSEDSDE